MSKTCTNISLEEAKRYSKNLHKALTKKGYTVTATEAQDLLAQTFGAKNWKTFAGIAESMAMPKLLPVPDIEFYVDWNSMRGSSTFYKGEVAGVQLPGDDYLLLYAGGDCIFEIKAGGKTLEFNSKGMAAEDWHAELVKHKLYDMDLRKVEFESSNYLCVYRYTADDKQLVPLTEAFNTIDEGIVALADEYDRLIGKEFEVVVEHPYALVDWRPCPGDWAWKPGTDFDEYRDRTDALFDKLQEASTKAYESGGDDVTGALISYPVADGKAWYRVIRSSPLVLQHIPFGDAWEVSEDQLRGLTVEDIKRTLEQDYSFRKMFTKNK